MSETRTHVEKLEGPEDWPKWKWHIKMVLRSLELEGIVSGAIQKPKLGRDPSTDDKKKISEWEKEDAKAASVLASAMSKQISDLVLTCTSAKDIFDKLCARFERSSAQRLNMLIESFFRAERNKEEDIAKHIAKLQKLFVDLNQELANHKENTLSERLLIGRILSTLGSEFNNFKDIWDTLPEKLQTVNLLIEKLCTIELREDLDSVHERNGALLVHKAKVKSAKAKKKEVEVEKVDKKQKFPCNFCKKLGHWAAECPKKNKKNDKNKEKSLEKAKEEPPAFFASALQVNALNGKSESYDENWFGDSGATIHVDKNISDFVDYKEFKEPKTIILGKKGVTMKAYGMGNIKIEMFYAGKWHKAVMENVWYVPEASANLFSLQAAAGKKYYVLLDDKELTLMSKADGKIYGSGYLSNGLFKMNLRVMEPEYEAEVKLAKSNDNLQLYHERFAHQNKKHVKEVLKRLSIETSGETNELCDDCALGKSHRLPFRSRKDRPTVTGELINADVNGPMENPSLSGARYFVCFKDDFSKFRRVFFMKHKSEVVQAIEQFLNEAKTNGHVVKGFRCDGGKEFVNKLVSELLASRGIRQLVSCPYTPQQDGVAERENRTIVESATTMIQSKGMPKHMWAEASNTAAYVLNLTGKSSDKNKSPYELWYGKELREENIKFLKVFGTECFVHIPKQFRSKFDNRAVRGHIVGYVNEKDGYRIWVPSLNKVVCSHDVRFKPEIKNEVALPAPETAEIDVADSPEIQNEIETEKDLSEIDESQNNDTTEMIQENERKRTRKRPNWMNNDFLYMCGDQEEVFKQEPKSYEEAIQSNERKQWEEAMNSEIDSQLKNDTWTLVKRPKKEKVLQNRWVLRLKKKKNGNDLFKARLVAKGHVQKEGIDFQETFSPVARYETIRTILAVAGKKNMKIEQFDVRTAFLYGSLEESIYMEQPKGFDDGTNRVCLLKRSLYGLKQSPRCWNSRFTSFMKKCKLQTSTADPCLFYRRINGKALYVVIYVDDGLVVGDDESEVNQFIQSLQEEFQITHGSLDNFLGMEIRQGENSIRISQEAYIVSILKRFHMEDANPISTPAIRNEEVDKSEKLSSEVPYREAVGCLMHLTVVSRPDIAYAVSKVARSVNEPTRQNWLDVKRILRYLKGTKDLGIVYRKNSDSLTVFSDADYAGDKKTRRSTSGVVATLSEGAITWMSQLQKTVALSTTEAELVAACEGAKEAVWLERLLAEMLEKKEVPLLYVDNASAVKLAKNPGFHKRSKHVDVRHFYIRELIAEKKIQVEHIPGSKQLADILTKPLEKVKFEMFRSEIGLCA